MAEHDANLVDGIFSDDETEYAASRPPKKDFDAWHRPRKQFVRKMQWVEQTARLLDAVDSVRPLRYMSLPGVDLLDVRYLQREICQDSGRPMVFLGFNRDAARGNEAQVELAISLQEVRNLPGIDRESRVVPDDFRLLASASSTATKAALDLGPFDVVNLDLCDGVGSDNPGAASLTMYDAINELMGLQARRSDPWLFLLTFRMGAAHFDPAAFDLMLQNWHRNLAECDGFEDSVVEHLGDEAGASFDPTTCSDEVFFKVGVGATLKWLLGLAVAAGQGSEVKFASSMSYAVEPGIVVDDLVSVALVIKPMPTQLGDPAGLAASKSIAADECKCACRIASRVERTIHIDTALREDPELRVKMIDDTAKLLSQARFDIPAYMAWVPET